MTLSRFEKNDSSLPNFYKFYLFFVEIFIFMKNNSMLFYLELYMIVLYFYIIILC